jgi:hypothetical protein
VLRTEYLKWQKSHIDHLVETLTCRHRVPKQQGAAVCGITPSHLSHLVRDDIHRRKRAGIMLVRLLEALATAPSEFRRHLEGRPYYRHLVSLVSPQMGTPQTYVSSGNPTPAEPARYAVRQWQTPLKSAVGYAEVAA